VECNISDLLVLCIPCEVDQLKLKLAKLQVRSLLKKMPWCLFFIWFLSWWIC